jgi:F-type H+/Na+-transporting ATPase subunit beta
MHNLEITYCVEKEIHLLLKVIKCKVKKLLLRVNGGLYMDSIKLNVQLLRQRVPNLTVAARSVGLRPATVSNLCTGKIPIGRAEVRTLVTLAQLANCTLDELIIQGKEEVIIETGIKVIDLFSPIVKGGTIGLVARPGMGQLVVLAELIYRLKTKNYTSVVLLADLNSEGMSDVLPLADFYSTEFEAVFQKMSTLVKDGDILLAVDRKKMLSEEFFKLQERISLSLPSQAITYAIVDTSGEAVDEDLPYGPLETLWKFDMDLAVRRLYPAIDPLSSISTVLEGLHLEKDHLELQQKARKVLRRYKELRYVVHQWGEDKLSENDKTVFLRGERLEFYFTQPFYTAEEYTGQTGEWVSVKEVLEDVKRILDGELDEIQLDQLKYKGKLS